MTESTLDLSRFFDLSVDMLCVADTDGFFQMVNPALERTLGYSQQELLARPFIEFVHPNDVTATLTEVQKLAAGVPTHYFENRYRCQDGTYKWLAWTAYPVNNLLFSVARDITTQKKMHSALEESDSLFKALFQTASLGIVMASGRGEIVMTNLAAGEIFGYGEGELVGSPIERLLPKRLAGAHRRHRDNFLSDPQIRPMGLNLELLGCRKDRSEFPVEVGLSFVETRQDTLVLAFVIDISRRKYYEAERDKLVEELQAFAHTVAHDLQSPLGLISGHADLLLTASEHLLGQEQIDSLKAIEKSSRKMSNIIDALLMLASIRDIGEIELATLEMDVIMLEVQYRLEHLIAETKASIILPDIWPISRGYAPWVEEIWVNYVSNALKYGGRPPQIEIGGEHQADGMVRYWVKDNGQGIAPEHIPLLFNRFTRLDQLRVEGHGLGLSIVKRIAGRLGGGVGVKSVLGQGSTFTFTLPQD